MEIDISNESHLDSIAKEIEDEIEGLVESPTEDSSWQKNEKNDDDLEKQNALHSHSHRQKGQLV